MPERWICRRCYTSAEGTLTACPNCGLARSVPPARPAGEVHAPEGAWRQEDADHRPDPVPPVDAPAARVPDMAEGLAQGTAARPGEIEMRPNFECGRCGATIYRQWWSSGKNGYMCRVCGMLNVAPGRTPSELDARADAGLVRTYAGTSRDRADQAFHADAAVQATAGFVPISETWQQGGLLPSGLLSLAEPLMDRDGGTLTVTYGLSPTAPAGAEGRGLRSPRGLGRLARGAILAFLFGVIALLNDAAGLGWAVLAIGGLLALAAIANWRFGSRVDE